MTQENVSNVEGGFGTSWGNEPTIADLRQDFTSSRSNHDTQVVKINNWLDNLNTSTPSNKSNHTNPFNESGSKKPVKDKSKLQPKLIRKQAEWRYTSLSEPFLNTPDIYNVDPVTYEDVKGAEQNAMVLNNQFNTKIDKTAFIDEYVRTCVNEGTVICRIGWNYESEEVTNEYPVYELFRVPDVDMKSQMKLNAASKQDPRSLPKEVLQALITSQETGIPHWVRQTGVESVTEEKVTSNHPTVEVCNYNNVIIDPSCGGNLEKAKFIIYSFETSKDDLEKTGLYKNLGDIQEDDHSPISDADHEADYAESGFTFKDKPRMKMVAYEYWGWWDIDGSGVTKPIVATWIGETLIRLEENPYPDKKLPFVAVPYLPVKDSIYGEPDGELLADNQAVMGALQRGMIDVMARSANGQIGIRKDALDSVNRRRYDKGQDYEFNPGVDPRNAVIEHTYPELPRSAFEMLMFNNNEAESLTGIKDFNQGISGAGLGATAAAARGALDAAARRELGILRRLAEGMKKIGRKFISMNQTFLSEEETLRITNTEFVTIRRDDLEGNFDLRLSISTAEADEQKAQELAFMLQTTGQNFGLDMYKLILAKIAKLRKMPELAYEIESYNPEPDPLEQQLKQQEVLKAQLENAKIEAEIAKIYAEAGHKQADATKKASETDKLNLDYVEQEAGVTQERALEKDKAQARGNMELEVLKDQLAQRQALTETPANTF